MSGKEQGKLTPREVVAKIREAQKRSIPSTGILIEPSLSQRDLPAGFRVDPGSGMVRSGEGFLVRFR